MTPNWAQWQGQVVGGEFRLDRYLGGTGQGGTFATEFRGFKAAIKLRVGKPRSEPGAELSHPHLLPIHRVGQAQLDGTSVSYIVMELADEVLASFIPERPLEADEAGETLAPVLDALAYLHGRGLTHGHLKPGNIMSVGEKLKISSDGLRRSGESGDNAGASSPYDAPELAEGRASPASDVWSLGITLVEMLTQRLPAAGGAGEPAAPATLPPAFRDIASHCLRRDPQRRWTVSQISDRLAGRAPVEPILPSPAEAAPAQPPPAAARKRSTTAIVLGIVAIVVVLGAIFLRSRQATETPAPVTASQPETPPSAKSAPPAPPAEEKRPAAPAQRVRGKVEHQAEPEVSAKALDTINGRVRVRVAVKVDPMGNVVDAKLDTPRVSPYFATAALQAARRWKFAPPTEDGNPVASSWVLEFDFGRAGVQLHSREVS